jgi:hypothetical protein
MFSSKFRIGAILHNIILEVLISSVSKKRLSDILLAMKKYNYLYLLGKNGYVK